MPGDRVQRRIDRLLDQAEEAADKRDWNEVLQIGREVLSLDGSNDDATALIGSAETMLGFAPSAPNEDISAPSPSPVLSQSGIDEIDPPHSFAHGRYQVKKFLGEGGKKKVFLAHDATLDRDVAFALIKTEGLDAVSRHRITREAQAMGRLGDHPHIVPIFDLGEEADPTSGATQPFMVLPLMTGGDVEGVIEDAPDHRMPLDQALRIAKDTCEGLVFAHDKGLVHRDLKPGNVWLTDQGVARIGDFGLAVATDRSRLTREGMMVGTVAYMPPEQAMGGEVTPRADLYSLGAMLYEMVTGRPPFLGDDDIAIIGQHINTPPVAPSWHNSAIPKALDALVMRLLAKDPAQRPESAAEVLDALRTIDPTAVEDADSGKGASLDSMAGGVFVGRQREMDQLKATLEEMLSGKGRMVTLVGEPGIGKTRTAQELATYASMRSAQVLWGRSYESGGAPPYWPWVQAIRSYVASVEPDGLRRQMGSTASVIAEIVPDVKEKLPGTQAPPKLEDPESARFRLFDSVATFLKSASSAQPIVLMLEDLHWADKPSLMLLEFVARELGSSRLMLVGNYRDVELNRRHPLSVTLGELTRERLFERVLLRGLRKHDVARFIEIAAGIAPPTALVDAVFTQTEGNPLFITETVRLLIQEGNLTRHPEPVEGRRSGRGTTSWEIRIPEGVREVIGRRLDRLSERCNEVLTLAAVMGRQFRFSVLLKLMSPAATQGGRHPEVLEGRAAGGEGQTAMTESMLLDAMDEALSARIIEELPNEVGFYQFTHAQIQETLTLELSANRRVRLHARIAEALEDYYGDKAEEHAEELVEHFAEAETVLGAEKVVHYSAVAGERALAAYAHTDALSHFDRALAARAGVEDHQTAVLFFGLGRAQSGAIERYEQYKTEQSLSRAFDLYLRFGDRGGAVSAAAYPTMTQLKTTRKSELVKRALEIRDLSDEQTAALKAEYAFHLANDSHDPFAIRNAADDAVAAARKVGNRRLELRAMLSNRPNRNERMEPGRIARVISLAKEIGDPELTAIANFRCLFNSYTAGDGEGLRRHVADHWTAASRCRVRARLEEANWTQALLHHVDGEFEAALNALDRLLSSGPMTGAGLGFGAWIHLETGNIERASEMVRRLVELKRRNPGMRGGHWDSWMALLLPLSAEIARLEDWEWEAEDSGAAVIADGRNMVGPAGLALSARRQGRYEDARRLVSEIQLPFHISPLDALIGADHLLGLILSGSPGTLSEAERHYRTDLARLRKLNHRPELAWILHHYAELLYERNEEGEREQASKMWDESLGIARNIGMRPLVELIISRKEILKA